jgi:hypothetical protein
MKITEEENDLPRATPTRELMNIFIDGITIIYQTEMGQ